MLIRRPHDWHDIMDMIELGARMHAEGNFHGLDYSREKCAKLGQQLLNNDAYFSRVCEYNDEIIGMMICFTSEFYFGHDLIAQDMLLYIDKSRRGGVAALRMIEQYVEWATEQGCKEVQLGITTGINDKAVAKLYDRAGFSRIGQLYKRGIS